MRFDDFLLGAGFLTKPEYISLDWHCTKGLVRHSDAEGFLKPDIQTCRQLSDVQRLPFGDVLLLPQYSQIRNAVFQRSNASSIDDLVHLWHRFHVENFEPISEYSLTSTFGKNLHRNVEEKKLCGHFLAKSEEFGVPPMIHDGDHVFIPEGTSAFYVGLAIGAYRRNITFITSNGPFLRELSENPVLASSAKSVLAIGGELDADTNGHVASRGFVGFRTEKEFEHVMTEPGATVLVSSVNGLLPSCGPFAPTDPSPKSGATRFAILNYAMEKNIRQIVFISDYSKMLESKRGKYGEPIFSDHNKWKTFVDQHRRRLSMVVAPPPGLAGSTVFKDYPPRARPTVGLDPEINSPDIREYLKSAKELEQEIMGNELESRFYETFRDDSDGAMFV